VFCASDRRRMAETADGERARCPPRERGRPEWCEGRGAVIIFVQEKIFVRKRYASFVRLSFVWIGKTLHFFGKNFPWKYFGLRC
jgi:hypothetical protein